MHDRQAGAALPGCLKDAPSEDIDEALNEIDELCERWDNGLSVKNLPLAERYLKGELEFGAVFEWQPHPNVSMKCVAIFERKLSIAGSDVHHRTSRYISGGPVSDVVLYSKHLVSRGYRDEQLMFVNDVETVQTPQHLAFTSTVRLQSAYDFFRICGRPIESSKISLQESASARVYWERCVVTRRTAAIFNELDSKQVEGRTQIVNTISEDSSPFRINGDEQAEIVRFITGTRVMLDDLGSIRFSSLVSADGRVKVCKVFFGPVNLYANATKVAHDKDTRSNERP